MILDVTRPRDQEEKDELVQRALKEAGYDGKDENEVD